MSNVRRFVSRLGNDLMPSVSVNVTDVVNSSGCMDTQVFVYVNEVNAATETMIFKVYMKVCDRYELLSAMLNGMLPVSGFLTI